MASLPLVVDLENDPYKKGTDCYGVGVTAMTSWIAGFTGQVHALTGKWPVIYTTAAWWRECTGSTSRFRHDPLWLAAFGGTRPTVPSPWAHWTFWQYDNAGFLPGIGQTDLDYYQLASGLPGLRPLATPAAWPAARRGGGQARAVSQGRAQEQPQERPQGQGQGQGRAAPKREPALGSKHGLKSKHRPPASTGQTRGTGWVSGTKHRRPVSRTTWASSAERVSPLRSDASIWGCHRPRRGNEKRP